MSDFMGNPPAIKLAVSHGAIGLSLMGLPLDHSPDRAVLNADMLAGGIHKGTSKHPGVPHINPGARPLIQVIGSIPAKALGGIGNVHHLLHGQTVLIQLFNLSIF